MKSIPIAQYLSQLQAENAPHSIEPRLDRQASAFLRPKLISTTEEAVVTPPEPSIEARIVAAYERGLQEGRIEAHAEHARHEAAREADYESRQQKERREFLDGEYARLADAIGSKLDDIEERITGVLASILKPYLAERQSKMVAEALYENVEKLFAAGAPTLLRIHGPEKILSAMSERLSDRPVKVEYCLNEGIEAVVEADESRIETQLHSWLSSIS